MDREQDAGGDIKEVDMQEGAHDAFFSRMMYSQ